MHGVRLRARLRLLPRKRPTDHTTRDRELCSDGKIFGQMGKIKFACEQNCLLKSPGLRSPFSSTVFAWVMSFLPTMRKNGLNIMKQNETYFLHFVCLMYACDPTLGTSRAVLTFNFPSSPLTPSPVSRLSLSTLRQGPGGTSGVGSAYYPHDLKEGVEIPQLVLFLVE